MARYRVIVSSKADKDLAALAVRHFGNNAEISRSLDAIKRVLERKPEQVGWVAYNHSRPPIRVVPSHPIWVFYQVHDDQDDVRIECILDYLPDGTPRS